MRKNKLFSSIITIVLCLSLIAGSTYALFTSSDEVNIAVTAGEVKVSASLSNFRTYSMDKAQADGMFANGGTATYANKLLTLDRITPGDRVEFNVNIENNSNVDVQYRVRMSIEGKLAEVLVASAELPDGEKATLNSLETATIWMPLASGTTSFPMSVELPELVGNAYQGKLADISIVVEAIQGNATAMILMNGQNYDSFDEAIAAAQGGETIYVAGNVIVDTDADYVKDMKGVVIEGTDFASVTTVGNGTNDITNVTIKNATVIDKSNEGKYEGNWEYTYLEFAGDCEFDNVVFTDGILVNGGSASFENCSFIGHFNDSGDEFTSTDMYGVWVNDADATFKDCYFTGTRAIKVYTKYVPGIKVIVDHCSFATLSVKPGLAITDKAGNADINIFDSAFINTQRGGANGERYVAYIYETDDTDAKYENCFVASDDPDKEIVVQDYSVPTLNAYFADGKGIVVNGHGATLNMNSINGSNMFASLNGELVTINDLTITGTVQANYIGRYNTITGNHKDKVAVESNFNTILNNVNIIDVACAKQDTQTFGAAAFTYGNATLNNCTITGTREGHHIDGGFDVYDLGVVNHSVATLNNSKVGSIWMWFAQSSLTLNDTDVDLIEGYATRRISNIYTYNADDGLIINGTSHVGKINLTVSSGMPTYIEINDYAVVDVLELTDAAGALVAKGGKIIVSENATIGTVIYNGTTYASVDALFAALS